MSSLANLLFDLFKGEKPPPSDDGAVMIALLYDPQSLAVFALADAWQCVQHVRLFAAVAHVHLADTKLEQRDRHENGLGHDARSTKSTIATGFSGVGRHRPAHRRRARPLATGRRCRGAAPRMTAPCRGLV